MALGLSTRLERVSLDQSELREGEVENPPWRALAKSGSPGGSPFKWGSLCYDGLKTDLNKNTAIGDGGQIASRWTFRRAIRSNGRVVIAG